MTIGEITNIQFVGLRNKWHVCNIHARAAIKFQTRNRLRKRLHVGCALKF